MRVLRRSVQRLVNGFGYQIVRNQSAREQTQLQSIDPEFIELYEKCQAFSSLGIGRLTDLYMAANYVIDRGVPGDFVECGVGMGGVGSLWASVLARSSEDRGLYLFDTYEGAPSPGVLDEFIGSSESAKERWQRIKNQTDWTQFTVQSIKSLIAASGLPSEQIHLVPGLVQDTIPDHAPDKISLLHLDTNYYDSTIHELRNLLPRLSKFGVLAIDDYGNLPGVKKAVDEYVADTNMQLFFTTHGTGRIAVNA
jgi:hypothetical protein